MWHGCGTTTALHDDKSSNVALINVAQYDNSLRRTFITQMATKGIDKKVLMDITGHSKFETISKYYYGVQEKSKSDLNETMNTFFNEYK